MRRPMVAAPMPRARPRSAVKQCSRPRMSCGRKFSPLPARFSNRRRPRSTFSMGMWSMPQSRHIHNPEWADEQVRGGCVQGIGGALYEHCIYDDPGQLVNGTMADYLTPMAGEMPDIDVAHVQTLTSVSELGAKGVGESG